jgi:methyl-accepting chemotaxis protein
VRNVWKGLVLGAVTGAAIGFGLDVLDKSGDLIARGANKAVDTLGDHFPDAVNKTQEAAAKAGEIVADKASDVVESAKQAAGTVRDSARGWTSGSTS